MLLKDGAQGLLTEGLKASQNRMVGTTAEAGDSFVAHTQSDECRMIEIEGKIGFWSRAIFVDQPSVDPDDFQGTFLEVMRLLCIKPGFAMRSRVPGLPEP